jgi:hypothetical protein
VSSWLFGRSARRFTVVSGSVVDRSVRDRAVHHDLVDDRVPAVRGLSLEHRQCIEA